MPDGEGAGGARSRRSGAPAVPPPGRLRPLSGSRAPPNGPTPTAARRLQPRRNRRSARPGSPDSHSRSPRRAPGVPRPIRRLPPQPGSDPGGATRLPAAPEVGAVSSDLMGLRTPAPRPESATGPDPGRGGGRRGRSRGDSSPPPFRRRAGTAGAWEPSLRETARRSPLVGLRRRRTADRCSRVLSIRAHTAIAEPAPRPGTAPASSDRSAVPLRRARRPFPPTASLVS